MASRASNKFNVLLKGGPFSGYTIKKSPGVLETLTFKSGEFHGYYDRGQWIDATKKQVDLECENAILGYN